MNALPDEKNRHAQRMDERAEQELLAMEVARGQNRNDRAEPSCPPVIAVDAAALLRTPFPPREMLLSPWLQSQSLSMIYAWRGVGKTHIALGIAYSLASGGKFLDWAAPSPVPVLYIDGEMPGAALCERVAEIVAAKDEEPLPEYLRFVTPDLQLNGSVPNLATREGQEAIESVLGDSKVIIVDNLSCLVRGGKENESDSWQPLAEFGLRMRAQGRSVIFIHHAGKSGQQRGTSKREDILDTVLLLRRPSDYEQSEGARFEIHFEKARSLYGQEVTPIEAKLDSSGEKQIWVVRSAEAVADKQMIELAELGLSQAEIARELGCHRSTVLRALRKAEDEGRYRPTTKRKQPLGKVF